MYLLPELSSDVAESFATVKTHCFQSAIAQHLDNLSILLAIFFEDEFAFLSFVLVLSPSAILSSLTCKLVCK